MIRRLAASLRRDLLLQYRAGYPWIAALAALACIAALARIPQGNSDRLAPFLSLAFSAFTTLPFLILQVDGERREGTLGLLDLTPLRPHEYLASKAISLALPSVSMNTLMVLVSRGPYFNPVPFWTGLALAGFFWVALGFLVAAWSGNAAKAGALAGLAAAASLLPTSPCLGLPRALLWAHPLAGPAGLLADSYTDASVGAWITHASMGSVWALLALAACRKGFARFRRGGRGG
jgi:fluoroquinolone transport system permease protein